MTEGTFIFLQANIRFKNLSHSIYPNIDGCPQNISLIFIIPPTIRVNQKRIRY